MRLTRRLALVAAAGDLFAAVAGLGMALFLPWPPHGPSVVPWLLFLAQAIFGGLAAFWLVRDRPTAGRALAILLGLYGVIVIGMRAAPLIRYARALGWFGLFPLAATLGAWGALVVAMLVVLPLSPRESTPESSDAPRA